MIVDNNSFAKELNTASRKKWCKACTDIFEQFLPVGLFADNEKITASTFIDRNINAATVNRLKDRIETLETQNDKLHQYLSFLIENLPDLILKTIHADLDLNELDSKDAVQIKPQQENCFSHIKGIPIATRREKDVLELLAKGYCAKEIASQLFISETTVITHKKNLKKKFNVKNTVELVSKIRSMK
jgi:DNA-binding NarL/FixJ family response regulator